MIAWSSEEMDSASGRPRGLSASWWGNGPPRLRRVAAKRELDGKRGVKQDREYQERRKTKEAEKQRKGPDVSK